MKKLFSTLACAALLSPYAAQADDSLPKLLITEYIVEKYEAGGKRTSALEVTNVGETAIDMSTISIQSHYNGAVTADLEMDKNRAALVGTLAAGDSYVIVGEGSDQGVKELADFVPANFAASFTGNDAMVILSGETIIDSIGVVGADNQPDGDGFNWVVDGVSTSDYSLRREVTAAPDTDVTDVLSLVDWRQFDYTLNGLGCAGLADCSGSDIEIPVGINKVKSIADYDADSYYANALAAGSNNGTALKNAINKDIKAGYSSRTYSEVTLSFKETDADPANPDNVMLFFKGNSVPHSDYPEVWNREHNWPKSYGFPVESQFGYTDLHHLRPSDANVNSAKSNLEFDNGGRVITDDGVDTGNYKDSNSFEPRNAVKGDTARAMMYMDTRYDGSDGNMPDLELTIDIQGNSSRKLGRLCTILQWHKLDPVSSAEVARNNVVFEIQGNRNPFVDHPEWADVIYGEQCQGVEVNPPASEPDAIDIQGTSIMITEYIAGEHDAAGNGSDDIYAYGALEITNLSDTAIPFANIELTIAFNGSDEQELLDLNMAGKILGAGNSHLITSVRAVEELQTIVRKAGGTTWSNNVARFTGDDSFFLSIDGKVVDSLGRLGQGPEEFYWGTLGNGTQGTALRRELDATPDTIIDDQVTLDGWVGFPYDDFSGLGCAGIDACPVAFVIQQQVAEIAEGQSAQFAIAAEDGSNLDGRVTWTVVGDSGVAQQIQISDPSSGTVTISVPEVADHTFVQVNVEVDGVSDLIEFYIANTSADQITLSGETAYTAAEGEQVTFTVTSSKASNVSYSWSQNDSSKIDGFSQPIITDTGSVSFKAPFVSANQSYSFTVVVSDVLGYRSAQMEITLNVTDIQPKTSAPAGDSSGGGGSMHALLFVLAAIGMRRLTDKKQKR